MSLFTICMAPRAHTDCRAYYTWLKYCVYMYVFSIRVHQAVSANFVSIMPLIKSWHIVGTQEKCVGLKVIILTQLIEAKWHLQFRDKTKYTTFLKKKISLILGFTLGPQKKKKKAILECEIVSVNLLWFLRPKARSKITKSMGIARR